MEGADWQTIVQVLQTQSKNRLSQLLNKYYFLAPGSATSGTRPSYMDYEDQTDVTSSVAQWNCPRCTFINDGSSRTCEICSCEKGS
jgi:hypothetical protein